MFAATVRVLGAVVWSNVAVNQSVGCPAPYDVAVARPVNEPVPPFVIAGQHNIGTTDLAAD